jgi:hypothetical protein
MTSLPGGRGYRSGPDAWTNQQESFESRLRDQSKQDLWTYGAAYWGRAAFIGTLQIQTNLVRLGILDPPVRDIEVKFVRLRVETGSADNEFESALYVYEREPQRGFRQIAWTHAVFDVTTTGTKTLQLRNPGVLRTGFIYAQASHETFSVGRAVLAAVRNDESVGATRLDLTLNHLPTYIARNSLTLTGGASAIPAVTYLSNAAAQVI